MKELIILPQLYIHYLVQHILVLNERSAEIYKNKRFIELKK